MLRLISITLTVCSLVGPVTGQKLWTLQECILYARQNSIAIKRAQNAISSAEVDKRRATHNRYPSLNANASGGYQFGRTIDPVSNSFNTTSIGFNGYSLNAGVNLFNGNRINNQIQLAQLDLEAARLDADFMSDNLSLDIATAYLNILLAEEQLQLVRKRLEQSQVQLDQTDKLIQAGSLPENDRLNILSQIATDEQTIIDAQNQVEIAYLTLSQTMLLDPTEDFRIVKPNIEAPTDFDPDQVSLNETYVTAMSNQANIKANQLRMQSAEKNVEVAKADFYPRLTIGGSITTNYSNAARTFTPVETTSETTVSVNGEPFTFTFDDVDFIAGPYPYFDQLSDNLGQSLSAGVSIPLYNGFAAKLNTERARLGVINQELVSREAEQTLLSNIQQAIANAKAAKRSLDAAQIAVNASQAAFDNAKVQFDLGAINSLDFSTARINLDQSQISLIRAKYSYIFNIKQIEFYQGKGISLN